MRDLPRTKLKAGHRVHKTSLVIRASSSSVINIKSSLAPSRSSRVTSDQLPIMPTRSPDAHEYISPASSLTRSPHNSAHPVKLHQRQIVQLLHLNVEDRRNPGEPPMDPHPSRRIKMLRDGGDLCNPGSRWGLLLSPSTISASSSSLRISEFVLLPSPFLATDAVVWLCTSNIFLIISRRSATCPSMEDIRSSTVVLIWFISPSSRSSKASTFLAAIVPALPPSCPALYRSLLQCTMLLIAIVLYRTFLLAAEDFYKALCRITSSNKCISPFLITVRYPYSQHTQAVPCTMPKMATILNSQPSAPTKNEMKS
ncbi:hypothetical protein M5K25_012782 [Dendrobium thyrsiflorum]|uniref:Uncharacterized protein n=1 Tax=Dendrobium thyrsiflorum TaxID=117978 RepID=A0ABD0UYH5_DENTH